MSYLVLARRLRPCIFDDLIGQEINAKILRNAVLTDRVAHAFLFTGTRGVGKTSAARILARAINCLNPAKGNPCNICENCNDINNNTSQDIFEIDAASNRGIDNIRELRENVNYVPARCRFKVYIIDEAHMLTLESFNALLKTLEEPPPYVKFIFATTDPHKIPHTIISRCQRFDFLRIAVKKIADFLEKITEDENLKISRKALEMIGMNSAGGMRDALTSIDQILSIEGESVSDQKVAQILGILDTDSRFALAESLLNKNSSIAIQNFHKLQEHGHDVNDILTDLLRTVKTIALVQTLGKDKSLFQDFSTSDLDVFESLSKLVKNDELQQIFQILLQLEDRLKISSHSKICFEMTILQITSTYSLVGLNEILSEIKNESDRESLKNNNKIDGIDLKSNESAIQNLNNNDEKSDSNNLGNKKDVVDASSIKELFESDKKKSIQEKNNLTDISFEKNLIDKNLNGLDRSNDEENFFLQKNKINGKDFKTEYKYKNNTELEKQISKNNDLVNRENSDLLNKNESLNKPPNEWINFSNEIQKKSSKLASFVRNAIPQSLSGSTLKLIYKNMNYTSMLDENNKKILEQIASELSGHSIKIIIESSESLSSKHTISEYEKLVIENEEELKRKNAIENPQVKEVMSVFKNSKVSKVELPNE